MQKITLCKHMFFNDFCPYGQKCTYAHSIEELKAPYKIKLCRNKDCKYGNMCSFAHNPKELFEYEETINDYFFKDQIEFDLSKEKKISIKHGSTSSIIEDDFDKLVASVCNHVFNKK